MDTKHLDELLRANPYTPSTRRTAALLLAGGALGGVAARLALAEDSAARQERKKQKKGALCMSLRQSCAGAACCGGLSCGDNGCSGGNVCFLHEGGNCSGDCDCRGDMNCSERHGGTCQQCGYPETPCWTTSDCCLSTSICEYNGCDDYNTVCCQWEIGSLCYDDCDCCAELGCFGGACLPLLHADGSELRKPAAGAAEQRPATGQWPQR